MVKLVLLTLTFLSTHLFAADVCVFGQAKSSKHSHYLQVKKYDGKGTSININCTNQETYAKMLKFSIEHAEKNVDGLFVDSGYIKKSSLIKLLIEDGYQLKTDHILIKP